MNLQYSNKWIKHSAACSDFPEVVKKEQKMGDKVIPVKVAVRVRPLVPKEVRKEKNTLYRNIKS